MAAEENSIKKRFTIAKRKKERWGRQAQAALNLLMDEAELEEEAAKVELDGVADDVFDSTGSNAHDDFVSNLQSSLFPPFKEWIQLQSGFAVNPDTKEESNKQLAQITDVLFGALKTSNFDTEISSAFYDYALGVGALLVNKGTPENPFHFTAIPVDELYLERGALGRVGASYRENEIEYRNIQDTWPEAKLSETMEEQLIAKPDAKVKLIEAMIPEKVTNLKPGETEIGQIDGWCYYVIEEKTGFELLKREYKSNPWVIFRWPGRPKRIYPKGPLLKALPDIRTLNKTKELLLKKGSRDLYGMYTTTDDGAINVDNITFGATCFIPVESNGGVKGETIKALPSSGDLNLGQFLFNDLQQGIRKTLFAEPLGKLDLPVKTATEVAYRQQELAKKIGAAFGKLQFELMGPLINRMLHILDELGLIDIGDFKVDGRIINLQYMSPLAMAQDQEEFDAARTYVATVTELYGPQVAMVMAPPDRFCPYFGKKLHVEAGLIPTETELKPVKEALFQQGVQQGMAGQAAAMGGGEVPAEGVA